MNPLSEELDMAIENAEKFFNFVCQLLEFEIL